ncbi:DNA translocase FtsK 4TM domain-containing protein [Sphingomonas sp. FW199]|uniref:FtsK/SpoIIIE family DNA translocase n=1 Tax=Sphingomonas sp. FW199 TaxID=3400217 RepID=UPI003CF36A99
MASRPSPMLMRSAIRDGAVRSMALIGGLALLVLTLLAGVALATYSPADPALNTAAGGLVINRMGIVGAYVAELILFLFGVAGVLLLPLGLVIAWRLLRDTGLGGWRGMLRDCVIGVLLMGLAMGFLWRDAMADLPAGWGGIVGLGVAGGVRSLIELIGGPVVTLWASRLLAVASFLGGVMLWSRALSIAWPRPSLRLPRLRRDGGDAAAAPAPARERRSAPVPFDSDEDDVTGIEDAAPRRPVIAEPRPAPVIADRAAPPAVAKPKAVQTSFDLKDDYRLPSIDLLKPSPPRKNAGADRAALERNSRLLETVLDDFNVKGQIVKVSPGPVVTMYELEPAAGIKASRVIALADDIARNMSAISARVATIPGRSVIGIELPNANREMVSLHELVASQSFEDMNAQLPIVLGKNIAGDPVIADLAPMPHLLVAGTTGSGKSVGLNAMILSLLYRLTPDQCRMIMIDPKMLELSIYKGIPHLLADVVTEPPKAVRALKWAVEQMEERYRMMANVNVRNLASFNEKVRTARAKGEKLGRRVQVGYEDGKPVYEEEILDLTPLPQIVIVVDELADLMMTAGKEVEFLIQRLAQKARAAGIHLIMATQRPSVDVITGVIKANLPRRISFHVTSKIDSRTILGEQGAEQLLGKGDMLYMSGGKQLARIHGPFVSDEEVQAVADHWRAQGEPDYIDAVTEEPEDGGFALDGSPVDGDSPEDNQYRQAIMFVASNQKASTSWLQRQMRIGYNSAARLIERMEKDGLVGRPDHVGRREVLMDEDGRPLN